MISLMSLNSNIDIAFFTMTRSSIPLIFFLDTIRNFRCKRIQMCNVQTVSNLKSKRFVTAFSFEKVSKIYDHFSLKSVFLSPFLSQY